MVDLPDDRIRLYKPAFSYMGIDFGPLVVKHSKRTRKTQTRFKRYDGVFFFFFFCLKTCAEHLDLLGDLSRDSFPLALIRGSWQEEKK